jgi:hypothetical protein
VGLCKTGEWLTQSILLICSISVRKTDGHFVWWILRHLLIYSIFLRNGIKYFVWWMCIFYMISSEPEALGHTEKSSNLHPTIESYMRKYVPSFSN